MTATSPARAFRYPKVSTIIYLLVYLVSLIVTALTIFLRANTFHLELWHTALLAICSTGLLIAIYRDMHKIDDLHEGEHDYPGWATADLPLEWFIRLVIVFSLLVGVGEFVHSFRDARDAYDQINSVAAEKVVAPAPVKKPEMKKPEVKKPEVKKPDKSLVFLDDTGLWFEAGSLVSFSAIMIWNIGALLFRTRNYGDRKKAATDDNQVARDWLITFRILLFAVLSFLCAWYWGMVWLTPASVSGFVPYFVVVFFALFLTVLYLLFIKTNSCAERFLVWLFTLANRPRPGATPPAAT